MAILGSTPVQLKYQALLALVVQNSLLILTMRYSRVMDVPERYLTSTAVLLNELIKLAMCLSVSAYQIGFRSTVAEVLGEGHWKLAIPAGLYTLQNSLQYVAASNLEAATFQVTYQLKILTTAFFAVVILHKRLQMVQWMSLLLLTAGVSLVQLPDSAMRSAAAWIGVKSVAEAAEDSTAPTNTLTGFMAVAIACVLSGLAGIYFEKVLKGSRSVSLWVRNIQLSMYSLIPALFIGVIIKDGAEIASRGFFSGYNGVVISVVLLQAVGGIVVALCVKFADNIAKNFATSLSIIISAVVSVYVFGSIIHWNFLLGAATVIGATFLYSRGE